MGLKYRTGIFDRKIGKLEREGEKVKQGRTVSRSCDGYRESVKQ